MKIGIVGLPNVGKSTLFNAFLKRQQALSANYPFATIEPNIGVVDVPDNRVDKLTEISKSEKSVYANITFVDIAGIVEGAHKGEGLGNQFLSHIREVDLILVLLRDFGDKNVAREGSKNPEADYDVVLTELILKDLETIDNQISKFKNKILADKRESIFRSAVQKIYKVLDTGKLASSVNLLTEENIEISRLCLLTMKPILKVLNIAEKNLRENFDITSDTLQVSAKIEADLASLSKEDRTLYLKDFGLSVSPLNEVIKLCYNTLGLETFLTTGVKESRAWKFQKEMNARQCAGIIHSDFEKNFVKAEVVSFDEFVKCEGKLQARKEGKLRIEGKEYIVQDGDVVEFKVNV